MNELEEYLLTNNTVNENNYKQFNYDSYEEFRIDLDFLLSNIYSDIIYFFGISEKNNIYYSGISQNNI
jgi:hypothetical protein